MVGTQLCTEGPAKPPSRHFPTPCSWAGRGASSDFKAGGPSALCQGRLSLSWQRTAHNSSLRQNRWLQIFKAREFFHEKNLTWRLTVNTWVSLGATCWSTVATRTNYSFIARIWNLEYELELQFENSSWYWQWTSKYATY